MLRIMLLAFALLLPAHALAQCLGDFDGDGTVRVNELVVAVNNALRGCHPTPTQGEEPTTTPASKHSLTPTPSPTNVALRGPDLLVVRIDSDHVSGPCQGPFAYVSVCIRNDGDVSAGVFHVAIAEVMVAVDGLNVSETKCLRGPPLTNGPRFIEATIDPENVVAESNETNNAASGNAPFPTVPATCRPTATATPSPPSNHSEGDDCDYQAVVDDQQRCESGCSPDDNRCECEDRCDGCGSGLYCYPLVIIDGEPVLELGATCDAHGDGCIIIGVPPTRVVSTPTPLR